ncbi:Predicted metal-dependent peptidase [Chitinophaga eiseniae]|uniref:Predicted metal-dependent peptidase n=1 Tax=Chitinophaga eiseniae TaxID=634771 RepID=A0A1T4MYU5_9BACT|nr:VWA-like domain-containing protein [Chitinophaga eiseniae]SJZ72026.1 Predicted metal-dependent peptidase [Chitinophaga eiseniae]
MDHRRILEEVTRTSIELLMQEPFYSHFFAAINKEVTSPDSEIQTMAVGLRQRGHTLYINPTFWDHFFTDKRHRYGVVKHEVLHIVFKHTLVWEPTADRLLVNIAMDIVVNQYIDRAQLPVESVFLEGFPDLNLEKNQTWQYYYEKLVHLRDNIDTLYKDCESARMLCSISAASHGMERHRQWREIFERSQLDKDLTSLEIDNLINIARSKTSEKSYGKLPGSFRAYLDSILLKSKPLVDWRRVIRLFSESSSKTKVRNTLKRPSRRFGTNPGIKIRKQKKLLIAVDTSGSVGGDELATFFNEVHHLWRQGAEIHVLECDAAVQRVYTYKGTPPEFILGRGGTDFNPPIAYGNDNFRPDGLIYFTDGVAPAPTVTARFPLLWVISNNGIGSDTDEFRALPGRKAKLISS